RDGAIIRGPREQKRIALVFTGHEFGEGGETILNELARHKSRASFFLTGAFLTNSQFTALVGQIQDEWHYLGPHSDRHLLYCAWEESTPMGAPSTASASFHANAPTGRDGAWRSGS